MAGANSILTSGVIVEKFKATVGTIADDNNMFIRNARIVSRSSVSNQHDTENTVWHKTAVTSKNDVRAAVVCGKGAVWGICAWVRRLSAPSFVHKSAIVVERINLWQSAKQKDIEHEDFTK